MNVDADDGTSRYTAYIVIDLANSQIMANTENKDCERTYLQTC